MSMSLVAGFIFGSTAIVFNSHSTTGTAPQTKERANTAPSEPREPAAATQATTTDASALVN